MSKTVTGVFKGFTKANSGGYVSAIIHDTGLEFKGKEATFFQIGKKPPKFATGTTLQFEVEKTQYGYSIDPDSVEEVENKKPSKPAQEATGPNQTAGSYKGSYDSAGMDYGNARSAVAAMYSALITAGRFKDLNTDEILAEFVRHVDQVVEKRTEVKKVEPVKAQKKVRPKQDEDEEEVQDDELPY